MNRRKLFETLLFAPLAAWVGSKTLAASGSPAKVESPDLKILNGIHNTRLDNARLSLSPAYVRKPVGPARKTCLDIIERNDAPFRSSLSELPS